MFQSNAFELSEFSPLGISTVYLYAYISLQLNDKEEALAHQRKVSYMLARNTAELEQRLLQLKGPDSGMAGPTAGLEAGTTDGRLSKCLSVPHNPGDSAGNQTHRQIKGKLTMEPA